MKEFIEIPFGAKDSELGGWEYTIPEGMEATIVDNKIVVKNKESEDEKIRKELLDFFDADSFDCGLETEWRNGIKYKDILAWLEKQSAKISVYKDTLFKIATILSQYEDKDDSPLEKIRSIMIDGTICSMDLESKKKEWGEQKPTDEEMKILLQTEYEKGKADAIEAAMESVTKDKESAIKFLKSAGIINDNGTLAKEYVADNIEQKTAWSEDDEEMFDAIIADIQFTQKTHNHEVNQVVYEREIDWLKSIKDRFQQQNK